MLTAGKTLGDRYQIIKQLGEDSFGDTDLAKGYQLPSNTICVVKNPHGSH